TTRLTGKTPNNFIKDYRLHKALVLLHNHHGSIAQIAKQSGFNSPTYFSECFLNKYGVRPSTYAQQHGL
ncbi:MAG: helix-turn-helix transcriptional regulator, partial [Psychroserpens sp.]|nr:helix-turn-helix transcriptional regulator [Psychroserpens sp.]